MLPSVTKRYCDRATENQFVFSFLCDACEAPWESEIYPFSLQSKLCDNAVEEKARTILWAAEHIAAYERANNEALFHFNKCPKCGRWVCDNCFSPLADVCILCKKEAE